MVISCGFFEKGCEAEFQINSLESLILHEKKCLFNNSTLNLKDTHVALDSNYDHFCIKCSVYYNKPHECISEMNKNIKLLNNEVILLKQQNNQLIQSYDSKLQELSNRINLNIRNHSKKTNLPHSTE